MSATVRSVAKKGSGPPKPCPDTQRKAQKRFSQSRQI
jgi:hypothetical protein